MTPQSGTVSRTELEGPLAGNTIVVEEFGDSAGLPVVFLHGEFGAFPRLPLDDELIGSNRVLAIHLPGWGESQGGDRFENLGELATALWWSLDQCSVNGAVITGHGIGATAAVEMAIQQPGRVLGLCLAAPYGLFRTDDPGVDLFGTLPKELMGTLYEEPQGGVALDHFPVPSDGHEKGLASLRRAVVLGTASRYIFPIPDTGIADRLYRLHPLSVVLVFGSGDRLVPKSLAEDWQRLVPSATMTMIEGAVHMHPYERPDFSNAVESLIARAAGVT